MSHFRSTVSRSFHCVKAEKVCQTELQSMASDQGEPSRIKICFTCECGGDVEVSQNYVSSASAEPRLSFGRMLADESYLAESLYQQSVSVICHTSSRQISPPQVLLRLRLDYPRGTLTDVGQTPFRHSPLLLSSLMDHRYRPNDPLRI